MNLYYLSLLMGGASQGADGAPGGSSLFSFLPLIAIVAIFYFLILRPQNKKQKETQRMLAAIKKGDRVITIGGIHGVIQTIKDSTVIIKIDDSTKVEFNRNAIASVSVQAREEKEDKKLEAPEDNDD